MFSTPADDAIALHYQPLADCQGSVVGFEALMRWHHQKRGAISPEAFIPIFEQSGLIVPLSRWALNQACLDAAAWGRPLSVSFNLSATQFEQEDLPALVSTILADTGLDPERLDLETSEATLVAETERTLAVLLRLRDQGVNITLDRFGAAGGSRYLRSHLFSKIKMDRSFVAGIEVSAAAKSIIRMIVDLGHSMQIAVAANGVETDGQLAFLRGAGCDLIQGFLVGRPAEVAVYAALTGNLPLEHH